MAQKKPFTLILLGDPTAGKDTQSQILAKKYNLHAFSSGQALRDWQARDPEIAKVLAKDFDKGKFAPTWVVKQVYIDNFKNSPKSKELLLNGNPRKLREANLVLNLIKKYNRPSPIVIYLYIPDKEVAKRSAKRAMQLGRPDDRSVATRLKARNEHLLKTFKYLQGKVPTARVSGMGTVSEVTANLVKTVEKLTARL